MLRVDRRRLLLSASAAALQIHHRLNLPSDIVRRARGNFGLLHQLQQVGLHAATAHVATAGSGRRGNLVDLVDVDDAVLRALHVAIGATHQFAHEIFHVAADVASLGKLCCVTLHERHADQVGHTADEIRFAHARGADEDDVLLGVIRRLPAFAGEAHLVVMITERDAQHFLRFVLLDDKAVEMRLHVARLEAEIEIAGSFWRGRFAALFIAVAGVRGEGGIGDAGKILTHEVGKLPLKFFRRRRRAEHRFHQCVDR